ncbi:MAG TPA: UDP-glucose--hexose-1-phosphate uridylyltransferase [Anaerolineaceae bacterium]|nr:UDP-glucose--hexose-1-phosphate uridylyltransferase [Anaerolineaceae bacterium]
MNFELPHRRFNPLTRDWVLVSPQRARRPWLGQMEKAPEEQLPPYDPGCSLCPGNSRAGGALQNPKYTGTFVFDNDFMALLPPEPGFDLAELDRAEGQKNPLFKAEPEVGLCRVICFSPRHDLSLPELSQADVEAVVRTWADQTMEIGSLDYIRYVQIFENKGAVMGCSQPHPHCQVWASGHIPNEPAKELIAQSEYLEEQGSCLICDYLAAERRSGERVIAENEHFTALIPFWAIWPFEVFLAGQRHAASLPDLTPAEAGGLADILRQVTARYDNLFEISFPYSMGFHQAPSKGGPYPGWHLHAHFYPPLLRSATVRKFMVGYEMLAMPQRDITPETAAERLRSLSVVHYKQK